MTNINQKCRNKQIHFEFNSFAETSIFVQWQDSKWLYYPDASCIIY